MYDMLPPFGSSWRVVKDCQSTTSSAIALIKVQMASHDTAHGFLKRGLRPIMSTVEAASLFKPLAGSRKCSLPDADAEATLVEPDFHAAPAESASRLLFFRFDLTSLEVGDDAAGEGLVATGARGAPFLCC